MGRKILNKNPTGWESDYKKRLKSLSPRQIAVEKSSLVKELQNKSGIKIHGFDLVEFRETAGPKIFSDPEVAIIIKMIGLLEKELKGRPVRRKSDVKILQPCTICGKETFGNSYVRDGKIYCEKHAEEIDMKYEPHKYEKRWIDNPNSKKKKTLKSKAKKAGRKIKKAAKTDVGRAGIGGGIGAIALGPIGAVAGAGIAMATKKKKKEKKNPTSLQSTIQRGRRGRATAAADRSAKAQGAASEVSRRSLRRRLASLNPETLSEDKTLKTLTKEYIKRDSHLNAAASSGRSVVKAEKSRDEAEGKLILYAEIRGLQPEELQHFVEYISSLSEKKPKSPKKLESASDLKSSNPLKKIPKHADLKRAKSIISKNIEMEMAAGRPQKQAVAIALSSARKDAPDLVDAIYGPKPNPYYGDAVERAKMKKKKVGSKAKPPPPPEPPRPYSKKVKPIPERNPGNDKLIKRCHKLWEAHCARPTKKSLQSILNHLDKMKLSSSDKVKKERARCMDAAKKEMDRLHH